VVGSPLVQLGRWSCGPDMVAHRRAGEPVRKASVCAYVWRSSR
jgi:hypothetical protein